MLLDFLLAGLVIGGIYALISIGLNLQYGVARVLNLAYGEFLMLAGYGAFWGFTLLGLSPVLTLFVGAPLAFALSWLLFTYVLHPLLGRAQDQGKREIDSILSTFGLLFVLQGVALVAWSGTDRAYSYLSVPLNLFGAVIGANRLLVLVAALALSGGVYAFLRYSPVGRAMRAIAVSPRTAPLVGIDVARYSALAFAAGGALAAVAGILLSSFVGINPTIGAAFTMKALIVVVMGGIGHVLGGLVAGLMLGLAETLAALLLDPGLITVINFAIFSIVLLWRPQGLFGAGARSGTQGSLRLPKQAIPVAALLALERRAQRRMRFASTSSPTSRWRPAGRSSRVPRATSRWRRPRSSASAPTRSRSWHPTIPTASPCWRRSPCRSCSRPSSGSPPCASRACTS